MTKRVYKYPIPKTGFTFSHMLPAQAQFLRVAFQNDQYNMWFLVDVDAHQIERKFRLYGTGQDLDFNARWLCTYDNGPFVLHLFEIIGG